MSGHQATNNFQGIHVAGGAKAHIGNAYNLSPESPLRQLPFAEGAPFNAWSNQFEPVCLQDTRVELLRELEDWASRRDEQRIYWLSGLAGTGKSTIARTIARRLYDSGLLGASFFFSKGGGDLSHARKFFTTIAIQLSIHIPQLKPYICEFLSKNSIIGVLALADQWRNLVYLPLSRLKSSTSPSQCIILIDALDECEDEKSIREMLRLMADVHSLTLFQVRIIVTSRPETPTRLAKSEIPGWARKDFVLHQIDPKTVDGDIGLYFRMEFQNMVRNSNGRFPINWPGESVVKQLVQSASGLFIWASTACKFVQDGKLHTKNRLDALTRGNARGGPELHLDNLYKSVLESTFGQGWTEDERQENLECLKFVLGAVVTILSPLSFTALSALLCTAEDETGTILDQLHSILHVPADSEGPIRLHHPSFHDFLLNPQRGGLYAVSEMDFHQMLFEKCIQLLSSSLKQNIIMSKTLGAGPLDFDAHHFDQCLPSEVRYASLYWVRHFELSGQRNQDCDAIHMFLKENFLYWIEALGWMQKVAEGISMTESLTRLGFVWMERPFHSVTPKRHSF